MAKVKTTRDVEFYRCWPGREGDSGQWDTDFMPVPIEVIDAGEEAVEKYIRENAPKLEWKDDEPPLFVGLYSLGSDEEEYEDDEEDDEQEQRTPSDCTPTG